MNGIDEEIKVKQGNWQTQYEELRHKLVPGRGKAETLQGEMIRIVGKITYSFLFMDNVLYYTDYLYHKILILISCQYFFQTGTVLVLLNTVCPPDYKYNSIICILS